MNQKSQVLIIILWILVILTILAVSVGHRVSMALRLSRYQRDRLKAYALAKAGLNRAILELKKYTNDYDATNESWANNEGIFKEIKFDNQNEFAEVKYDTTDEDGKPETIYGVIDEERKININTANQELLMALLENSGVVASDLQTLAYNIRAWRGDKDSSIPDDARDYKDLGYTCKEKSFSNIEELSLVKGITPEIYQEIKGLITVYPKDGTSLQVNVNTVSKDVLTILANSVADNPDEKNCVGPVVESIINQRKGKPYFDDVKKIANEDVADGSLDDTIFNGLKTNNLTVTSNYFKIEAIGNVGQIKKKITAIVKRGTPVEIVYWHEN